MRRVFAVGLSAVALWLVIPHGSVEPAAARTEQAQECCKICRKGKACGNSCIARSKQCHQPPGCACDA